MMARSHVAENLARLVPPGDERSVMAQQLVENHTTGGLPHLIPPISAPTLWDKLNPESR